LRLLLNDDTRAHRRALRWMLVTLEVGHAVVDLRHEAQAAAWLNDLDERWARTLATVYSDMTRLLERPDAQRLDHALASIREAIRLAQEALDGVHEVRERRHDVQRILSHLHFIRSALLDRDAPLGTFGRRRARKRARAMEDR
jgi:uncharacterized membrane protein YccC